MLRLPAKLAIDGGKPIRSLPLPAWPFFDETLIRAATDVLQSGRVNYWTGNEGREFEREFAQFCSRKYAVALANGTAALEAAVKVLDIGPGDEVIVPARTFIASASCAAVHGAAPVTADVDPASQTMTVKTIEAALTQRTKAIVAVHLAGWPCDMDPIMALARDRGLAVIEDCAQAQGAMYKGRPVGSFGDLACFSFCQDKIMTTAGEGGMLVTDNEQLWQAVWSYKDHGKNYAAAHQKSESRSFKWLHESFGTNRRMTEVQAAIGRAALAYVPQWVKRRRLSAAALHQLLSGQSCLALPVPPPDVYHAYYRYYAFLDPAALRPGWNRDRVLAAIAAEGIPCFLGSCCDISKEKAFGGTQTPHSGRAGAEYLSERSLCFLVHPTLADEDIRDTAAAIQKVLSKAAARSRKKDGVHAAPGKPEAALGR